MHCNFKPPDAAPVAIRFNFVACAKFRVSQPIHCCLVAFTVDTLRYGCTVTLIFYPATLTFVHGQMSKAKVIAWQDVLA